MEMETVPSNLQEADQRDFFEMDLLITHWLTVFFWGRPMCFFEMDL